MSLPFIPLPPDVVDYIRQTFMNANRQVAARLDRMPTLHEETLDFALIDALALSSGPHVAPSGVVVDLDIHFLGGGQHWQRWEVADIGLIVNFRLAGSLLRTKIILLQSKRIYPREAEFIEDRGLTRVGGFGSLMEQPVLAALQPRTFRFDQTCRYKALQVGDDQWHAIEQYENRYAIPVHYLLYHPSIVPSDHRIPVQIPIAAPRRGHVRVGLRVESAASVRQATSGQPRNYAPSYRDLRLSSAAPGIGIQDFLCDEVLTCRQGYVAEEPGSDEGLNRVFAQRGAPIAAALRFDIDLPESMAGQVLPVLG